MSRKRCECNNFSEQDGFCINCRPESPKYKAKKKKWRVRDNFHEETKIGSNEARPQEFRFRKGTFGISERGR